MEKNCNVIEELICISLKIIKYSVYSIYIFLECNEVYMETERFEFETDKQSMFKSKIHFIITDIDFSFFIFTHGFF